MKNKLVTVSCTGTQEHSSPLLSPGSLVTVVFLKGFSLPHKTTTQLIPVKLCSKENELLRDGDRAAPLHGLGGEAEKVPWPSSCPCARSYWWSFSGEGFGEEANPAKHWLCSSGESLPGLLSISQSRLRVTAREQNDSKVREMQRRKISVHCRHRLLTLPLSHIRNCHIIFVTNFGKESGGKTSAEVQSK